MSTELALLQNELTLAKQQNEIMSLRFELQQLQAQKSSRLEDSLFAPALYIHYQKVAETLSKSSVIPTIYRGKPEDIFVAMAMGYQLGFPVEQSLQDIAVINGRPCLWGDGLLSLCLNHPDCLSIKEEAIRNPKDDMVIGYQCTVTRRGHDPHTKQFTLQDAQVAGLLSRGTVWKSYPERMLQMRARSLALRDKFADALRGLRIAEIQDDDDKNIIEADYTETPKGTTQTEKLNTILKSNQIINEETGEITEEPKVVHNPGRDDILINPEQIDEISSLMQEKGFDEERIGKALAYHKVTQLEQLTDAQARLFLLQLEKV